VTVKVAAGEGQFEVRACDPQQKQRILFAWWRGCKNMQVRSVERGEPLGFASETTTKADSFVCVVEGVAEDCKVRSVDSFWGVSTRNARIYAELFLP
jgi:hypothetical protein